MSWRDVTGAAKTAVILALLSLFVSLRSTSMSSVNGVRSCSFMDIGALGFGAAAVLVGAVALARPGTGEGAGLNRLVGGAALLVGLWRAAYGLGLVGGAC
ncbi:MAG: hypothetical protein H6899_09855 [Rhodobacter sp.]|nr:hypothetical protein [Paracoccaceae bacterium]MCB1410024.1 hypothetical protein [Paracoccaceae bacterium]MCC0080232.1 hypothetical protein [Rhodobacter sp.]